MRPAAAVIAPMTAMVMRMPTAKSVEVQNARRVVIRPCSLTKPTISGMLARWQGLKMMLNTPHTAAAANAMAGPPSTAWLNTLKSFSMMKSE
jgi:hypothetical protein